MTLIEAVWFDAERGVSHGVSADVSAEIAAIVEMMPLGPAFVLGGPAQTDCGEPAQGMTEPEGAAVDCVKCAAIRVARHVVEV